MKANRNKFLQLIGKTENPILADGAMGTLLHSQGIGFDQCFDYLNITNKGIISDIHQAYIKAGSEVIYTNTFGANRYKLTAHNLENLTREINIAGVELARKAAGDSNKNILVAGDIGPLGVRLVPFGRIKIEEARSAFREQISALCDAGVDLIVMETFGDLYEIREAVMAAQKTCQKTIIASMTFTRDDRTILGDTPAQAAEALHEAGVDVIGANCSGGPAQVYRIIQKMQAAVPDAIFAVKPNAGWPEQVGGRVMYSADPDYFQEYAAAFTRLGVSLIGGCCGTTPEHISHMRLGIDSDRETHMEVQPAISSLKPTDYQISQEQPTILAQKLNDNKFVLAVEMAPPRGLAPHKIIAGASMLKEAGADVINVADSPMARMRMSPWAVCELIQRDVDIETTLHFPTRGRNLLRVQGDLLAAHALGIRNVFVVMGDPTSIGDYPNAMDAYDLVPSGLMKLIKHRFNQGIDHAGSEIGQPTSFFVGCALNLMPVDLERELTILRRKIDNGADFALTQPIYEPDKASVFIDEYLKRFGDLEIPVLVGILPLYSSRHAAFLDNEVPGIKVPNQTYLRIKNAGKKAPQEGIRIAAELINDVKEWGQGIYIMPPFDRYDLATELIESIL